MIAKETLPLTFHSTSLFRYGEEHSQISAIKEAKFIALLGQLGCHTDNRMIEQRKLDYLTVFAL